MITTISNTSAHIISNEIKEKAPLILAEILKAKSVLLHCHPSPDPDSVGSALAMKFVIEQLGKKATVIKGDSEIPEAFMHFPGAKDILMKSFWDIDSSEFDLFIILDSSLTGVSRLKKVEIPPTMTVINIDHHRTNTGDGSINIVDTAYPATAQLLFDILAEMKIGITPDIATNLFMGMYTDTGGFKYSGTTSATFETAAKLAEVVPDFSRIIASMENSNTLNDLIFQGAALSRIESLLNDRVALAIVPYSVIEEKKLPEVSLSAGSISSIIRTMKGYNIVGAMIEARPNRIRLSFRSSDGENYDISKLAAALGGGGHKSAAGVIMNMSLEEAKRIVVEKIKEMYNL